MVKITDKKELYRNSGFYYRYEADPGDARMLPLICEVDDVLFQALLYILHLTSKIETTENLLINYS